MPQVFKLGPYWVYFWSNENEPLEPIHVHLSMGMPRENTTKIWITKSGHCILENNSSNIPNHRLKNMMRIIEARHQEIINKWYDFFGEITYYC